MENQEVAKFLSTLRSPDMWKQKCPPLAAEERRPTLKLAGRLWLKRLAKSKTLYVHPDVLQALELQEWVANEIQQKMIWASVLASEDGKDSKDRYYEIKKYLLKQHDRDWWEDVNNRKKNAYAAKERIRKRLGRPGSATSMLVNTSIMLSAYSEEERMAALRMIPNT